MKSTLWTFGDSNTAGHGCHPTDEYYESYYKSGDKIWPVWLSEKLNVQLRNFGKNGSSNDTIIDTIIDKWEEINKDDYIFIGMTHPHRFDVPINNKFESIVHDFSKSKTENGLTNAEFETVVNFQYYFSDNILYKNRQIKRFEWIKILLIQKECKLVILWNVQTDLKGLQTIKDDTDGKIVDYHLSFKSHKLLSEIFYKKYFEPDLI
jgi:hypothetical protein